jgi:hypothetical protein
VQVPADHATIQAASGGDEIVVAPRYSQPVSITPIRRLPESVRQQAIARSSPVPNLNSTDVQIGGLTF